VLAIFTARQRPLASYEADHLSRARAATLRGIEWSRGASGFVWFERSDPIRICL